MSPKVEKLSLLPIRQALVYWHEYLGAEYPSPEKVNLLNYSRII